MGNKTTLHPSVQQFKQFVKKHPLIIVEVKEGKKSLQAFYEEWTILGEKDKFWDKYKKPLASDEEMAEVAATEEGESKASEEKQGSQITDLLAMLKSVDLNNIQGHIQNLTGIMSTVQGLLQSFQSNQPNQGTDKNSSNQPNKTQQSPFNFRQF